MNRHDPAERLWNALKRLALSERGEISLPQAIKRVKTVAQSEGAAALPERVLQFYADEYRDMVTRNKKE